MANYRLKLFDNAHTFSNIHFKCLTVEALPGTIRKKIKEKIDNGVVFKQATLYKEVELLNIDTSEMKIIIE